MNNELPDGIEKGDHILQMEDDRADSRGCMNIILVFVMIFGSGVFAGWAMTIAFGK